MRKLFLIIAIIATVFGVVFTFLPLDTIALAPLFIALIFGVLAYIKSDVIQKKTVNVLLIVAFVAVICVISKHFLAKDEVAVDQKFEKAKIESQKEAQKTLEQDLE